MADRCDADVFKDGKGICALDACMCRAEQWVQAVARESGQRVDWHYSGGIANVLYLGDYAAVSAAMGKLAPTLEDTMARKPGECGSCSGDTHRPGQILRMYGAEAHGLYREGDPLPEGAIAVDTLNGDVYIGAGPRIA
jgi:hypothetical protein